MKKLIATFFSAICMLIVVFTGVAFACTTNEIDVLGDGIQCETAKFSVTTTELAANTEFRFTITAEGTFYVDWGDGTVDTLSHISTLEVLHKHTYATAGVKTIRIGGIATEYSVSGISSVIQFGGNMSGSLYPTRDLVAAVDGDLSAIFPTLHSNTSIDDHPLFYKAFYNCTNLTTIPTTLFSGYTTGERQMFDSTFAGCSSLESIPSSLFANITSGAPEMFQSTFADCSSATGFISPSLFAGLIANNSPYETDMMKDIFNGATQLATECPCTTKQYQTGYESYWSSRVSCEPATEYTITYVLNGGTNYSGAPTSYLGDSCSTVIDGTPTKANAGFVGWCTDSTLQNCALTQTIPAGTTGNKTFYAKWLVCTGANFFDSTVHDCVACPAYYDYNTADGKTDVSQCQIQCAAGKFVEIPGVYGYTQLEYLESDGTQYIDTGFVHNSTNIRGEMRIGSSSNLNKNVNIIGNQTATGGYSVGWDQAFKIWVVSSNNRIEGPAKEMSADAVYDITYTLTGDSRTIAYEGASETSGHAGSIVTDKYIHLFDNGMHQTAQYFKGRIYHIKLYEDNVLVHEFVPVQRTGGTVGMYDTVTHTFFENSALSGPPSSVTDPCVEAGAGNYTVQTPINFGSTGTRTPCPAGTASSNPTASSLSACVACQGATYNGNTGAAACIPCPTGYNHNTTAGKTSIGQCEISCGPGTYVPESLGSDYTEVEYIETTGSQYINTGAKVSDLVDPIASMTLSYVAVENGKQNGAMKNKIQFKWGISYSGAFLCQAAGDNSEVTFGAADTNKHTFTLNVQNETCTMDGISHNLTIGNLSTVNTAIALANLSGGSNRLGKMRIYSFDLTSNNEVIRHMVPARENNTNTLGMLDTINNVFYTNAGSGKFITGGDVNVPQCVDVGLGYWSAGGVATYGNTSSRTQCESGKTTMVTNANSASQCVATVSVHNVTYSCGDGTGTPPASTTVADASSFTPAANPCTRTGFIFTGWGVSGTNDVKDAEVSFIWEYDEDKTLTAQWDTCPACDATHASCTHTGITNNVCTYTTACDTGYGNIQNNGEYNPICTANVYSITYTMDGGTNYENAPDTYTYGVGATIDGVPTKAGNVFAGWCTDAGLTSCAMSQIIANNEMGAKVFYAKWTPCTACNPTHASCELSVSNNTCTYTTTCEAGYGNIQNNGAYNPICSLLACTGATYMNNNVCTACPTGYDYDDDNGKTAITQCKINCAGGAYIATANDATCTDAGAGYWAPGGAVNYGSTGIRTQCASGLTTVGYGHGADEAGDCGRKLHINNYILYSKTTKPTTPAINIQPVDGNTVFYVGVSDSNHNLTPLHVTQGNTQYTVFDDSILHGERDFGTNTRITQ